MPAPRPSIAFVPRLLPAPQAAAYLGMSETMLRGLPIPRRAVGAKRLYDRLHLDAFADDLPLENEDQPKDHPSCDEVFGK